MILVTGGAGYVGSQVVRQLQDQGEKVVVLDNLITGDRRAIKNCPLVVGDVSNLSLLKQVLTDYPIQAIMHFAAHTVVAESVANPAKFYQNNTAGTIALIQACIEYSIPHFIFSSTAAVYGKPHSIPVNETSICQPINPYGTSKLFSEQILLDACKASTLRGVILRYFNVAGADPLNRLGPYQLDTTLLIRVAVQVALGIRDQLVIYGDDYQTIDGTGVRDYIHVADIAQAHIDALNYLRADGKTDIFNCGYGRGFSVKQVIEAVSQICGHAIPFVLAPRRAGDPDLVVADNQKIKQVLHWQPKYDDLLQMVKHAYDWEKKLLSLS